MAQNSQSSGAQTIVAALILGACMVASALLIRVSVDGAAREVASLKEVMGRAPTAQVPTAAAQPGRPDPSRRYSINTQGAPSKGNAQAKLAIVEFSDFQCPFCRRVNPTLEQIEKEYGDKVRIVFKHLPLDMHPKAPAAHAAAEAAHKQGKFWEMHDLIFGNQEAMSPEKYVEYAQQLGMDVAQFKTDVASSAVKARIDADTQEANRLGVTGTPSFFVNGRYLSGAQPFPAFKTLIDQELGSG
jgi:protein-disulfide isomerase